MSSFILVCFAPSLCPWRGRHFLELPWLPGVVWVLRPSPSQSPAHVSVPGTLPVNQLSGSGFSHLPFLWAALARLGRRHCRELSPATLTILLISISVVWVEDDKLIKLIPAIRGICFHNVKCVKHSVYLPHWPWIPWFVHFPIEEHSHHKDNMKMMCKIACHSSQSPKAHILTFKLHE